jgi:hypothetical protein
MVNISFAASLTLKMETLLCATYTRLKPEEEGNIFHGNVGTHLPG